MNNATTIIGSVTLYLVIGAFAACCTTDRSAAAAYARTQRADGRAVRIVREQCAAVEWAQVSP